MRFSRRGEEGQAAVEAALTLPLVLFLILGTLQLFMMLNARLLAEYAVYRAVRAGSLNHGDCEAMKHAAIVSLLPSIERTDGRKALVEAFQRHRDNRYRNGSPLHTGQIVELYRERPDVNDVPADEDLDFDQPDAAFGDRGHLMRLEARMIFWYQLKVPFANWVMSRMFLAHYGLSRYGAVNPLSPVERNAGWPDDDQTEFPDGERWPGGPLDGSMRAWSEDKHYLFPLKVNFGMRMMTPAKKTFFSSAQECPL